MSITRAQITLFYTYVCYDPKRVPMIDIYDRWLSSRYSHNWHFMVSSIKLQFQTPRYDTSRPIMDISLALNVKPPNPLRSPVSPFLTIQHYIRYSMWGSPTWFVIFPSVCRVLRGLLMLTRPVSSSSQKGISMRRNFAKPNDSEFLLPNINLVVV